MLEIIIDGEEFFDESSETFLTQGDVKLNLEHSLVSVSKWESYTKKPFLTNKEKTPAEILSYFYCMVLTPNVDIDVFTRLSQENLNMITRYIESPESATTFGEMPRTSTRGEIITSELIYFWMISYSIPFECQYWHLNRLFALIRICNVKNAKPQKMSRNELALRNRELNAQRRAALNTTG